MNYQDGIAYESFMKKISVPNGVSLRNVKDDDHLWLVDLHNDEKVLNNTCDPRPITLESHMAWWKTIEKNKKEIRLIFEIEGERVGFTKFYSIDRYNGNCLLGADIHPSYRGRGLAKFMWTLMLSKCFDEINLHRVALSTAAYNDIGIRLYKGLGFEEEGLMKDFLYRNGEYFDAICMYMLKGMWENRA